MKNDQRKVNFTLPTPICLSVEADLHQLASSLGRTRRREGDWQRTTKAFQPPTQMQLPSSDFVVNATISKL